MAQQKRSLLDVQRLIQNSLQSGVSPDEVVEIGLDKPPISMGDRLRIYQEAYLMRTVESLREDFEKLEESISEESFRKLAFEFVRKNPSRKRNLAEYSEEFPEYLREKDFSLFEPAVQSWMKILSGQALETNSNVSEEEITSGRPFLLQTAPHVIVRKVQDRRYMAFKVRDEVRLIQIESKSHELLDFLKFKRRIQDLEEFAIENDFNSENLIHLVFEWIRDGVIICLRSVEPEKKKESTWSIR